MKYFGDVNETLNRIIDNFENGNLPEKLAQTFISGVSEKHCSSYSFMNRLIVLLHGYSDAMGYQQWKKVGRQVKKGEKGFAILAPIIRNKTENVQNDATGIVEEKTNTFCIGFKAVKVFGYEQTEGEEITQPKDIDNFLSELPLKEVAEKWGISVQVYNGENSNAYGFYSPTHNQIGLGTKNLSTWTHELAHAADDKLGNLANDKRWLSEISAELAGAAILESLGKSTESDKGGCWEYIKRYANDANIEPIDACRMVLGRVSKIMELVFETVNETVTENAEAKI